MTEIITFNKDIKEGQLFIAKKSTVEGRDKVTLVPVEDTDYYERQEEPENYEMEAEVADITNHIDEENEREAIEEELEYRIKMEGHLS